MSPPSFYHLILKSSPAKEKGLSYTSELAFMPMNGIHLAWHAESKLVYNLALTSAFSIQQSSLLQRLRLPSCTQLCHAEELEQAIFLLLMWVYNAAFRSMTNATLIEYAVTVNGFTTA